MKTKKHFLIETVTFLILFLSISFNVTNNIISNAMTIALWIITLMLSLWANNWKFSIKICFISILLIMLILISDIINGENLTISVKVFFGILVAGIFAGTITLDEFVQSFLKVMKLLMIISLIGYFLNLIVPQIFSIFVVTNGSGGSFSNYILYVQKLGVGSESTRNFGFAWEPGAFATFICLAMMLEIFTLKEHVKLITLAFYLATVFTTFSTTGIIAALCLCLYMLIFDKSISKKLKKTLFLCLFVLAVVIVLMSSFLFDTSTYSVFGKLINFFNSDMSSNTVSSASIRVNSVIKVFEEFLKRPLIGWGHAGLQMQTMEYTRGMNTCTFVNWFAMYGVFFGLTMLVGMYKFSKKIAPSFFSGLIVLFFMFGITLTENYARSPIIFLLIFMGFSIVSQTHDKRLPKTYNKQSEDSTV